MSSTLLDQRREELFAAAEAFVAGGKTVELQRTLCDRATDYAKERQAHFKPQQNAEASKLVVPFGRSKGTPLVAAETKDLNWVVAALREKLDDPTKARYRADNERLIAAIERELGTR
jgi:hypothetical protein